jgi:cobalt/nickel transport system permease protein
LRHDFIDRYSNLGSPVHRLDPRVKVIAALAAIVIIVSEPRFGELLPFLFHALPVMAVLVFSRLPVGYVMKRLLIVSPFILMASLFYPLSVYITDREVFHTTGMSAVSAGFIILLKSMLAVIVLIVLSSTERFHRLLLAFRRLKVPVLVTTISALLYRYIFLIADETLKTTRARESRTPGRLRMGRIRVTGNQVAVIFLRSWERSQIIYQSMLSRGFSGEYPDMTALQIKGTDLVFSGLFIALLLSVRIFM